MCYLKTKANTRLVPDTMITMVCTAIVKKTSLPCTKKALHGCVYCGIHNPKKPVPEDASDNSKEDTLAVPEDIKSVIPEEEAVIEKKKTKAPSKKTQPIPPIVESTQEEGNSVIPEDVKETTVDDLIDETDNITQKKKPVSKGVKDRKDTNPDKKAKQPSSKSTKKTKKNEKEDLEEKEESPVHVLGNIPVPPPPSADTLDFSMSRLNLGPGSSNTSGSDHKDNKGCNLGTSEFQFQVGQVNEDLIEQLYKELMIVR